MADAIIITNWQIVLGVFLNVFMQETARKVFIYFDNHRQNLQAKVMRKK